MTFHCADRHIQHPGDIRRVEILLIPQQHDHMGALRQLRNHAPQTLIQKQIRIPALGQRLGRGVEADLRPQPALARLVDAAMADGAPQPPGSMSRTLNPTHLLVELQEDILREFLGAFPVAKETHRNTEYHRLVLGHDLREIHCHIRYYG